jgi:hypothetical protein
MCAEAFGIEEHRLVAACRRREVIIPRHATYYVLRERFPTMSLPQIGRFMGGRDHSTIISGIRATKARMEHDDALRELVQWLIKGRIPQEQDAHVVRWRVAIAFEARRRKPVLAVTAQPPEPDSELADFFDPSRIFCGQCDRSVTTPEALRCSQRFCGLKPKVAA